MLTSDSLSARVHVSDSTFSLIDMKKTISILCALVALGSPVYAGTLMDQSVFGYTQFADGLSADVGTQKSSITGTLGTGNEIWYGMLRTRGTSAAHFSGAALSSQPYGSTRVAMSVSLMLDTSKLVRPTTGFSTIFSASNAAGLQWGLGITSTGSLCLLWQANSSGSITNHATLVYTVPATGSLSLSLVTGRYEGTAEGTRLYVGNSSTYFTNTSLKFGGTSITQLNVGGDRTDNSRLQAAVQQLYVHDKALSQTEVGSLMAEMAAVPEPATATLSLLGLACMAWRRRRAA